MIWSYVLYALTRGQAPLTPLTRVSRAMFSMPFYVRSLLRSVILRWSSSTFRHNLRSCFLRSLFYFRSSTFSRSTLHRAIATAAAKSYILQSDILHRNQIEKLRLEYFLILSNGWFHLKLVEPIFQHVGRMF